MLLEYVMCNYLLNICNNVLISKALLSCLHLKQTCLGNFITPKN